MENSFKLKRDEIILAIFVSIFALFLWSVLIFITWSNFKITHDFLMGMPFNLKYALTMDHWFAFGWCFQLILNLSFCVFFTFIIFKFFKNLRSEVYEFFHGDENEEKEFQMCNTKK